ncbi:MAG: TIGR00730 family Rossman fold protein [Gammaproteobacteria bacterium]|nr:TIGR00730 family Rossman fold protein [Gammaproteobacteria bacterium]
MTRLRNICVYCGSSSGSDPAHIETARTLGQELVQRDIGLVYGGSSLGIMGAVADTVLEHGGRAVGVIPRVLATREIAHAGLTELLVVESMHERKAKMAMLADGFVALPGGLGTAEELFEILTWAQLGLHGKPCGILNSNGYYDKLISFIDHAVEQQFVKLIHRQMLVTATSADELLDKFVDYRPPEVPKWIHQEQT